MSFFTPMLSWVSMMSRLRLDGGFPTQWLLIIPIYSCITPCKTILPWLAGLCYYRDRSHYKKGSHNPET